MRALRIALVLTLGACGVSTSDDLSTAGVDDVPYDLLAPEVPTSTTTTEVRRENTRVAIWFVAGERILPLFRSVPAPADLENMLIALATGPTESEARLGARSAVPTTDSFTARVEERIAIIVLPDGFAETAPREQLLGLAQLVYTATELGNVDAVRFELDDTPIAVPRADGSVTDDALRRADYSSLKI